MLLIAKQTSMPDSEKGGTHFGFVLYDQKGDLAYRSGTPMTRKLSRAETSAGDAFSVARAGSASLPGGQTFCYFGRGRAAAYCRGRALLRLHAYCLRIITRAECGWRMHGIYLRESLTASSPA